MLMETVSKVSQVVIVKGILNQVIDVATVEDEDGTPDKQAKLGDEIPNVEEDVVRKEFDLRKKRSISEWNRVWGRGLKPLQPQ